MTTYTFANDSFCESGYPHNSEILQKNINDSVGITATCTHIDANGENTMIFMSEPLSSAELTVLDGLLNAHDCTFYARPFKTSQTLGPGEEYIAEHFYDLFNTRKVKIEVVQSETNTDKTFSINCGLTADYTISNEHGGICKSGFRFRSDSYSVNGNIAITGAAIASSSCHIHGPSFGNDGITTTYWFNDDATSLGSGSWWGVDFGTIVGIKGAEFVQYSSSLHATDVTIEFSNDGENWEEIVRVTDADYPAGVSGNDPGVYRFADFPQAIFARYFRFYAHKTTNSRYFIIREARLFEAVPTGYPTNTPSVITNNETRQIDTSLWKQIDSCKVEGNFPDNTTTQILLSFDGGNTWVFWNGSAWTPSSLVNISVLSMSNSTFDLLGASEFSQPGGLNSGTKTIDVAVEIQTGTASVTPFVSGLFFTYTTVDFVEEIRESTIMHKNVGINKTRFRHVCVENNTFNICIS